MLKFFVKTITSKSVCDVLLTYLILIASGNEDMVILQFNSCEKNNFVAQINSGQNIFFYT